MHLISLVSESIALWYGGFKVFSWARKCKIKKIACACQILKWANCLGNSICMFCWVCQYHDWAMELSEKPEMPIFGQLKHVDTGAACLWHELPKHDKVLFLCSWRYPSTHVWVLWGFLHFSCPPSASATSTTQNRRHLPKRVTFTDQCVSMTIHTSQLFRL